MSENKSQAHGGPEDRSEDGSGLNHCVSFWAVCLFAFAPLLIAQERPEEQVIRATGCLSTGVEGGCTVVTDRKSGQTYTVFFSSKRAPKGTAAISFEGVEHRGMTTCMQGKAIDVSKWSYVKMRCPAR